MTGSSMHHGGWRHLRWITSGTGLPCHVSGHQNKGTACHRFEDDLLFPHWNHWRTFREHLVICFAILSKTKNMSHMTGTFKSNVFYCLLCLDHLPIPTVIFFEGILLYPPPQKKKNTTSSPDESGKSWKTWEIMERVLFDDLGHFRSCSKHGLGIGICEFSWGLHDGMRNIWKTQIARLPQSVWCLCSLVQVTLKKNVSLYQCAWGLFFCVFRDFSWNVYLGSQGFWRKVRERPEEPWITVRWAPNQQPGGIMVIL